MVSLPIPLNDDDLRYSDLVIGDKLTYYDFMKQLRSKVKFSKQKWQALKRETKCHLDPDISQSVIVRKPGWKPCFGKIDAAQRHLENPGVGEDDLFLFFGWFRKTRTHHGMLEFAPNGGDMHTD